MPPRKLPHHDRKLLSSKVRVRVRPRRFGEPFPERSRPWAAHGCEPKSVQVRKAVHLEVVRVEGALASFFKRLKYLPTDPKNVDRFVKITAASLTEFIRVHRDGLKKLDPELYKKKGSSRDANVSYLNDIIIEGKMEVEGGWTT